MDKFLHTMAFNDQFMMLYMLICIYLILTDRPIMSSVMLSVALSIKAGVILMLPGFLGQLQYHYGTFTLLKCIILIFAIQVVVALPFLLGETSVSVYLEKSKLTGQGRN
jgi:uncharacterized membrane protein